MFFCVAWGDAERKLSEARANPWGGPLQRKGRDELVELAGSYTAVTRTRVVLLEVDGTKLSSAELAEQLRSGLKELQKASEDFGEIARVEMERIYRLIDEHFAGFETVKTDKKFRPPK